VAVVEVVCLQTSEEEEPLLVVEKLIWAVVKHLQQKKHHQQKKHLKFNSKVYYNS
jgi:hypothetical protein